MRTVFQCGVMLATLILGIAGEAAAQNDIEGEVSLALVVGDSEEVPAPPAGVWRFYGEPRQLRFGFSVANFYTSKVPVLIDTEGIHNTFGLLIERETEIPIVLRWLDGIALDFEPMAPPSASSWVRLEPRQQLGWTIVVERADGRSFEAGEYVMTSGFVDVRSAVRHVDGTPWRGRVSEGIGQRTLIMRPPTSAAERVRMHQIEANAALARGDTAQAMAEYEQLLALDPASGQAQMRIGDLHFKAGRYREAVVWWERVAQLGGGGSYHPIRLTMAYVGAGEERKAVDVLRAAGFSDEAMVAELEKARRALVERPPVQ